MNKREKNIKTCGFWSCSFNPKDSEKMAIVGTSCPLHFYLKFVSLMEDESVAGTVDSRSLYFEEKNKMMALKS